LKIRQNVLGGGVCQNQFVRRREAVSLYTIGAPIRGSRSADPELPVGMGIVDARAVLELLNVKPEAIASIKHIVWDKSKSTESKAQCVNLLEISLAFIDETCDKMALASAVTEDLAEAFEQSVE
jgi:hypothetical protein